MSETEPWWYDTLVQYARRCRHKDAGHAMGELPGAFVDWCVGVAADYMRDRLICTAIGAYTDPARDGGPESQHRACVLAADAAGLDPSIVAKIWRRSRLGQQ